MALKRKRSSPTISSPASIASDATSASPPPFSFQHHNQPIELSHKPTWLSPTYDDQPQQHLNSRTRKRYRNNRPDEKSVYGVSCWLGAVIDMSSLADVCRCAANTITMLYAAQKQLTVASTVPLEKTTTPPPEPVQLPAQRTTLHSFWRIPQPPPATSMPTDPCAHDASSKCNPPHDLYQDDVMDIDGSVVNHDTMCQPWQERVLV